MPELPEVETTCRGIAAAITEQTIATVDIRQPQLRWLIPAELAVTLPGLTIKKITRRGKYILIHSNNGVLIIHLGMSGCLRMQASNQSLKKHDHFLLHFKNKTTLCFNDPRRFGCVLWQEGSAKQHPLLAELGVEPLEDDFCGDYLFAKSRRRNVAIKQFIMDAKIVVGVGNIYASEALFSAGIHPECAAGKISLPRYQLLTTTIKQTLQQAINRGGTTLKDFFAVDGKPGYFSQELQVYGRADQPCVQCSKPVKSIRIAQRSTFYCGGCQR